MVMKGNGIKGWIVILRKFEFQRKTGKMKMWRKWTSRKKLEKWNCDEKEVGRILKKVVCKTPKRVRGQKTQFEVGLTWNDPTSTSTVRRQALLTISFALTFTIIPKETLEVMVCLLAVLIYLSGEESKKDCQCNCPVKRKGYCISLTAFLYSNSQVG